MKGIIVLFFIGFISYNTFSQTYKGIVYDENSMPLPYANVALMTKDSLLLTGGTTNLDGYFEISYDKQDVYLLKFSYIGYKTIYQKASSSERLMVKLDADEKVLSEIVVSAQKKIYKVEGGTISANVKNTYLTNITSTRSLISELPLISEQNGVLMVFGKGTPIILINGRQIRNRSELDQLSPKDIDKIELVTNPGAEYDASVGAIIKIFTMRKEGGGISFNFIAKQGTGKYYLGEEQISANYHMGKFDFSAGIGNNHEKIFITSNSTQTFQNNNTGYKYIYETITIPRSNLLTPEFGINYTSKRSSFGVKYMGTVDKGISNVANNISTALAGGVELLHQKRKTDSQTRHNRFNAFYNFIFNDKVSWFTTTDYALGNIANDNAISTNNSNNPLLTESQSDYSLFYVKSNVNYLVNKGSVLLGGEFSNTKNDQSYKINNESSTHLNSVSNHSIQNRTGLFINYRNYFKNYSYSFGLRYEYIDLRYYTNGILDKESSVRYNKLFPNIMLSYQNKESQFISSLSYESKVRYPSYFEMRSNIQYDSPYLYESGNPSLKPIQINNFTTLISYKNIQSIISCNLYNNLIIRSLLPYEDKDILIFKPINVDNSSQLQVLFAYSPQIKMWRPRLEVGMIKQWLKTGNPFMEYENPIYLIRWKNALNFKDNWLFRLNMDYRTRGHYETVLGDNNWSLNFGLSKSFLNNNLLIELTADDIFNTRRERYWIIENNANLDTNKKVDSRRFLLTLTCRLNSFKKSKVFETIDELNRLK